MATSTLSLLESLTPISQGAEAKVYKCALHGSSYPQILLKYRFPKQYRHPSLDNSLTKGRVSGEARMLLKCLRNGVRVPGVRMVDAECGILGLEWIEGRSVRHLLDGNNEGKSEVGLDLDLEVASKDRAGPSHTPEVSIDDVMRQIGVEIAKMHLADVIHGDLTTSNMMIRQSPASQSESLNWELVLIDFGLSFVSKLVEDKAVDLYVLERAFISTHPNSEPLFNTVLNSYGEQMGKAWEAIYKRLESVRLRGRKRSMVG